MTDRVKVEFLKAARQAGLEPRTVSAAPLRAGDGMNDDLRWLKMCPQFDVCSTNRCPLDVNLELRNTSILDRDRKCKARRAVRENIGRLAAKSGMQLPYRGLTGREHAGMLGAGLDTNGATCEIVD
jgi:hypothetical protein